jgi:hypothetical protein
MPAVSMPYFHAEPLRQRFIADVEEAVLAERINISEQEWLLLLTDLQSRGEASNEQPRVDSLMKEEDAWSGFELAAALLISAQTPGDERVYLSTLFHGIERFDHREQLLATLQERFADPATLSIFEYQRVEGDPFKHQSLAIIDSQARRLIAISENLLALPTLRQALSLSVQQQVGADIPGLEAVPAEQWAQRVMIIQAVSGEAPLFNNRASNLLDSALDEYSGVTLAPSVTRQFLNNQGQVLTLQNTQHIEQAITDAVAGLQAPFEQALGDYWSVPHVRSANRRAFAGFALSEHFRNEVLRGVYDNTLSREMFACLRRWLYPAGIQGDDSRALSVKKLSVSVGNDDPMKLAGMFLIEFSDPALSTPLLYSVEDSLRRFTDVQSMQRFLSTPQGIESLLPHLSLNDQPLLSASPSVHLRLDDIDQSVFLDRTDSIIGLQKRNLAFVLAQPRKPVEQAGAMIDDALDIRRLLDDRLLKTAGGRWREVPADFREVWLPVSPQSTPHEGGEVAQEAVVADSTLAVTEGSEGALEPGDTSAASGTRSWLERLHAMDIEIARLHQAHPGIEYAARHLLNPYLAVLGTVAVDASDIMLQFIEPVSDPVLSSDQAVVPVSESSGSLTVSLIDVLLERISGRRYGTLPASTRVLMRASALSAPWPMSHLPCGLIDHILSSVQIDFAAVVARQMQRLYEHPLRQGDLQIEPHQLSCRVGEELLRLELALDERIQKTDRQVFDMFEQVLARPVRSGRLALGYSLIDVYCISVRVDAAHPALEMTNAFVLWQALNTSSRIVFWSAIKGIRIYDSISEFESMLSASLAKTSREPWLTLFCAQDRTDLQRHLERATGNGVTVRLERVDGHFIEHLQGAEQDRKYAEMQSVLAFAARCQLDAKVIHEIFDAAETQSFHLLVLDALTVAVHATLIDSLMPEWTKTASIGDLSTFCALLHRYNLIVERGNDPLFDIPTLHAFAYQGLTERLKRDFVQQSFDPDNIIVTLRRQIGALTGVGFIPSMLSAGPVIYSETLTEYALNRFSTIQDGSLSITSTDQTPAAQLLTAPYLHAMVHSVDVGGEYLKLLKQKLDSKNPDYPVRKTYFFEQIPTLLLVNAFQQKLEGQLSAAAYGLLENVMEMPDGVARSTLDSRQTIICPLQLVAGEGLSADKVAGVYVFAPTDPTTGPLLLLATFHADFCFKEYASLERLQDDIRTSGKMQQLILGRIDPAVRRVYDHGGFAEPHLPWSTESFSDVPITRPDPVQVKVEALMGNALLVMFDDAMSILQMVAGQSAVTSAQSSRHAWMFLMSLGFGQTVSFLTGRLGVLVSAWQSEELLSASVTSAGSKRWGKALSEFVAALGVLASSRESVEESSGKGGEDWLRKGEERQPLEFAWGGAQLDKENQRRLKALEVKNLALSDLHKDELFNLYKDNAAQKQYAAIAGKVYQVSITEGRWRIVGEQGALGPFLTLDENQHWQMELASGLKGGGGLVTTLRASVVEVNVDEVFIVDASGMPEIRELYRYKARRIGEAQLQAKRYLENCLDNLQVQQIGATLDVRVTRIIGDFFGVQTPSVQQINLVKKAVTQLFDAIMDRSLSVLNSSRYVVGVNREGREDTKAFVLKKDPLKRIYLTERFFMRPRYRLKQRGAGAESFNMSTHYRALTLIHELSHQVSDSHDIAYLETGAPYVDLLAQTPGPLARVRADLITMQERGLSHLTEKDDLFITLENDQWRDLEDKDGGARKAILELTGQPTLEQARDVFLSDPEKRAQVMMANADSVALLVSLLGRRHLVASLSD